METKFDLKKIIDLYGLKKAVVASVIFPKHKYPYVALNRLMSGDAELSVTQLERLASYLGEPVSSFFEDQTWAQGAKGGLLTYSKGPYLARVNYRGSMLSIFKNDELISRDVLNAQSMTLEGLIDYLNTFINNYEYGQ